MKNKKIIDLIFMDNKKNDVHLKSDYQARIKTWTAWVDEVNDQRLTETMTHVEEIGEINSLGHFLNFYLSNRINQIMKLVPDYNLRSRYLTCLPPFHQQEGLKGLILHFFQFREVPGKNKLQFASRGLSEREVAILWDLYKVNRTLEAIGILKQEASSEKSFPSVFSKEKIQQSLSELEETLRFLVSMIAQPAMLPRMLGEFPTEVFREAEVARRAANGEFLIQRPALEKYDYRNYFFALYYQTGMKVSLPEGDKELPYNFLDYEIIRQEFLMNWLNHKLLKNPAKEKIYAKVQFHGFSFADLIKQNPATEMQLLRQLPPNQFNDLIAQINEELPVEQKLKLDPMSEIFGEFAKVKQVMESAKKRAVEFFGQAKDALVALASELFNNSQYKPIDWDNFSPVAEKHKPAPASKTVPLAPPSEADAAPTRDKEHYKIRRLEKDEIVFPFFVEHTSEFQRQMTQLKNRLGPDYEDFKKKVSQWFGGLDPETFIKRRTPKHEWVRAYKITDTSNKHEVEHLLIIGAQVVNKQLSMSYSTGETEVELIPYFVYGTLDLNSMYGEPIGRRQALGARYYIYNHYQEAVANKVLLLFDQLRATESIDV